MKAGKENLTIEIYEKILDQAAWKDRYYLGDGLMKFCRDCEKFDKNHGCPPLPFRREDVVDRHKYATLVCVKIGIGQDLRIPLSAQEMRPLDESIFSLVRPVAFNYMLTQEGACQGTLLAGGGCEICKECSKIYGQACRFPDKMRYSVDAFGIDIS